MKELTEDKQRLIAELYQKTKMSIGAIAKYLEVSERTVQRYKDLWLPQQRLK